MKGNLKTIKGALSEYVMIFVITSTIVCLPMWVFMGNGYLNAGREGRPYTFLWFDRFEKLVPRYTVDQQIIMLGGIICVILTLIAMLLKSFLTYLKQKR